MAFGDIPQLNSNDSLYHHIEVPYELATVAGGCFWCIEPAFDPIEGVLAVFPGYTGGALKNPTYKDVSNGNTGHLEAVQIAFDPNKVSYDKLLTIFWQQIDPTDPGGQFADRGEHYTTAIFYHNPTQKQIAEASKKAVAQRFEKPIVTKIREAHEFYVAEEVHQDYYKKNPVHYNMYKKGSGRADYIKNTWSN